MAMAIAMKSNKTIRGHIRPHKAIQDNRRPYKANTIQYHNVPQKHTFCSLAHFCSLARFLFDLEHFWNLIPRQQEQQRFFQDLRALLAVKKLRNIFCISEKSLFSKICSILRKLAQSKDCKNFVEKSLQLIGKLKLIIDIRPLDSTNIN